MQRKILALQTALLGATMAFGILLKMAVFGDARSLHRLAGITSLIASLVVMIIIVSQKSTRSAVILSIVAFSATLGASIGGNLTRTSNQDAGYIVMVSSFLVALLATVVSLYLHRPEKPHLPSTT